MFCDDKERVAFLQPLMRDNRPPRLMVVAFITDYFYLLYRAENLFRTAFTIQHMMPAFNCE
jgi:hypothetical protein